MADGGNARPPLLEEDWERSKVGAELRDVQRALEKEPALLRRDRSYSQPELPHQEYPGLTASAITKPGGFRREHLTERGESLDVDGGTLLDLFLSGPSIVRVFGGGLPHDDSDSESEGEEATASSRLVDDQRQSLAYQQLGPEEDGVRARDRARIERSRTKSRHHKAGGSIPKLVFTILKSFVGSAVLFLPSGFAKGGILFSPIVLALFAAISIYCMLLLVRCRETCPGSYGDIGRKAFGPWGKRMVNFSLVCSQVGFCCAYVVFIAQNLQHIFDRNLGVTMSPLFWVAVQVPFYVPLAWVRKIRKFAYTNLIADAFIVVGLLAILIYSAGKVSHHLVNHEHVSVETFSNRFPIFLGTAVYTFEGIGLVIPIHESTSGPARAKFGKVLTLTLTGVCSFFIVFSCFGYAALGDDVSPSITIDLPHDSRDLWWVISLQIGYSLALFLTFPLMLFPATRILEDLFFHGWPKTAQRKWSKNGFRILLVIACAVVSWAGYDSLDNFVALIGSFCCVPLAFIYPSLFHRNLVAGSASQRSIDLGLGIFGIVMMIFTSIETIRTWG